MAEQEHIVRHRNILLKMLVKITVYYVVLFGSVAIAVHFSPSLIDSLPLGGVGEISDFGTSSIYDLEAVSYTHLRAHETAYTISYAVLSL